MSGRFTDNSSVLPDDSSRAFALLADRATQGLDRDEERELERLLVEQPDIDEEELDRIAAALDYAWSSKAEVEPMTTDLRDRLVAPFSGPSVQGSWLSRQWWLPVTGWLAAAALLFWIVIDDRRTSSTTPAPMVASLDEQLASLVDRAPDLVQRSWTATEDPAASGVSGEVYWSTELQEGYMVFQGLEPNDPRVEQFQLWIFDRDLDPYPVDGGVFDARETRFIVPIDPKIRVREPWQFAVTVERPHGVVVSSKERIVTVAPI